MLDKKQWAQTLQSWLTASLFALCLSYFGLRLLGQYATAMDFSWPMNIIKILALCLIFGLLFEHWKLSLPLVALGLGAFLFQFFTGSDWQLPFLSPSFWTAEGSFFQSLISWIKTTSLESPAAGPVFLPDFLIIACSLLAVFTHWALPIPLLNLLFLIGPLFFIQGLTDEIQWIFALLAGLFCVYSSYAFRQDPAGRDQRPPITFGLTLLALTFLLSLVISPNTFYNHQLSRFINDRRPMEGGEVTAFSLKELGFYPQGNMEIGGPVEPSQKSYMDVTAGPDSLYLRGAAYDAFDGKAWSYKNEQNLRTFPWDGNFFDDLTSDKAKTFWFTDADARDKAFQDQLFKPAVFYQRTYEATKTVFTSGKPGLFGRFIQAPQDQIDPRDPFAHQDFDFSFFYTENGMVVSGSSYDEYGLLSVDHYMPLDEVYNLDNLADYKPSRGQAPRALEDIVAKADPELHEIVYGEEKDFVRLIKEIQTHFDDNYRYTLTPQTIQDNELFIENFLTNREGYCVYFASATAILLRDLGYESRYAEGFVLPFMDVQEGGMASRTLSGNQAHAWCEVHMEGLGWVPVETTPSSQMEALSGLSLSDGNNTDQNEPEESSSIDPEESSEESASEASIDEESSSLSTEDMSEDKKTPESPLDASQSKWLVFVAVIGAIILIVGLYILKKLNRWKERQNPAAIRRAKTDMATTMNRMWNEIKRMGQEEGMTIQKKDTVQDLIYKLEDKYQWPEIDKVKESLEAYRYGEQAPDLEDLEALHKLYLKLSQERKGRLSQMTWLFKEVLSVPGKSW